MVDDKHNNIIVDNWATVRGENRTYGSDGGDFILITDSGCLCSNLAVEVFEPLIGLF